MRAHFSNAAYGVLDYAAYPIAMLVSAPTLLKHLGVAQYGIWIVTTAALNTGAIIASGFGDANIQYIASARSRGDANILLRAVRSMLGINLLLGTGLAILSWVLVPFAVGHLVGGAGDLRAACLLGLRIASVLMVVRAVESVCVSTQRERRSVSVFWAESSRWQPRCCSACAGLASRRSWKQPLGLWFLQPRLNLSVCSNIWERLRSGRHSIAMPHTHCLDLGRLVGCLPYPV
jgi:hypothetical protein